MLRKGVQLGGFYQVLESRLGCGGSWTRVASYNLLQLPTNFYSKSPITMAGRDVLSRKRPLSEDENTSTAVTRKRQEIEPKSPKTAIRDASEALIEAIKKAEEVHLSLKKSAPESNAEANLMSVTTREPKVAQKKDPKANSKGAKFVFEKDAPTGLPYVYIVIERVKVHSDEILYDEVQRVYCTLEDANNFVREYCSIHAERDDPDAIFEEEMSAEGRISWSYEDENEDVTELRIEKCVINAPGSVPAKDWGRPIGAPCPPKEDSEDSEEERYHHYGNYIGYRARY